MTDPKDWTPSLPLRHDATEEQIFARELWLKAQVVGTPKPQQWLRVVREFADARVSAASQITDAQCLAAMREFSAQKGESHDAMWDQCDEAERQTLLGEWRAILECARVSADRGARSQDDEQIAADDRKAIEKIASECFAAGFGTPDGTLGGMVRAMIARLTHLEQCAREFIFAEDHPDSRAPREGKPVAWQIMSAGRPTTGCELSEERAHRVLEDLARGPYGKDEHKGWYTLRPLYDHPAPPVSQPEPSAQEKA